MNSKNIPENIGIQAFFAFAEVVGGHWSRILVFGVETLVSLGYTVKKIEGPWCRYITKVCFIQGPHVTLFMKTLQGLANGLKL